MAIRSSELRLVITANNRASRAMREVSASLKSMGAATEAAAVQQKFANAQQVLNNRLGKQRSELDKLSAKQVTATEKYGKAVNNARVAEQNLMNAQQRRGNLERQLAQARARYSNMTPPQRAMLGQGPAAQAQIATLEAQLQGAAGEEAKLATAAERATVTLSEQEAAVASLGAAMGATRAEIAQTIAAQRELAAQQARIAPLAARAERGGRLRGMGQALSGIGTQAGFVGAGGLFVAGLAANSAANLQRSTTLAATQASKSLEGVQAKGKQAFNAILRQMDQFPAKAEDMSASLYDIFSSTNIQSISKGTHMLTQLNKAAVAGQTDLHTATDATISIMNAFSIPVTKLTPTLDKMFAAVRYGRMTFTQFGGSLNTIVPAFRNANQSVDTMLGSLAFLTRRMPSVNASAVSLSRSVEILANPRLAKHMAAWGLPITNNKGNLLDLETVIKRILTKFPDLAKGKNVLNWLKDQTGMASTQQARRALTFLFKDFGQFQDVLHKTTGDVGEFTRSYNALKDTPANRMAVAMNKLQKAWLSFGDSAIPAITKLLGVLTDLAAKFEAVNKATDGKAGSFVAWGAAITLLSAPILKIIGLLMRMRALMLITGATRGLASLAGVAGAAGAATTFTPPVAGAVGGTAATGLLGGVSGFAIAAAPLLATLLVPMLAGKYIDPNFKTSKAGLLNTRNDLSGANGAIRESVRLQRDGLSSSKAGGVFRTADQQRGAVDNALKAYDNLATQAWNAAEAINKMSRAAQHAAGLTPQKIGQQASATAKASGFGARIQDVSGQLGVLTRKVPTAALMTQLGQLGRKAQATVLDVAASTHKMMSTKQLDKVLSMSQKKYTAFTNYIHAHHKMPPWVAKVKISDAIKAITQGQKAAQKFAKSKTTVLFAKNGAAMKGIAAANRAGLDFANTKYTAKITVDTNGMFAGFAAASDAAFAAGARVATQMQAGFKSANQQRSPSKVWFKLGVYTMQGLIQGMASKKKELIDQIKTAAQGMASAWDETLSNTQGSFGDLFQGTGTNTKLQDFMSNADPWTGKTPTKASFKLVAGDLKAQLYRFRQWTKALNTLRNRGIPNALYQQLLAAGPDSLPEVQALARASGKQLKNYNSMFRQEQSLINKQAKAAFAVQVKIWKGMGRNVAFGFLAGLRTESPAIVRYIRSLMKNIFHEVQKHNKSHSPSKLYMQEGKNMLDGLQMGMSSYTPTFGGGRGGRPVMAGSGGDTHYHYHAPAYNEGGMSGAAWQRSGRFDFERHIAKKLPR